MPMTMTAEREAEISAHPWPDEQRLLTELAAERSAHQETQAIARELLEALDHCYAPDHDWIDKKRAILAKAKAVLPAAATPTDPSR